MQLQQLLPGLWLTGAVSVLVGQPAWAETTQVTGVQLNPIPTGVEVILQTADGTSPQVITSSYDQTLLIDISNARLNLATGEEFRADNPTNGISSVTVTPLYTNSVRVTVIGEAAVPTAEVIQNPQGLVFSLRQTTDTAQGLSEPEQETSIPAAPETPDVEPLEPLEPAIEEIEELEPEPVEASEEFELVVTGERQQGYSVPDATTATRTDTPLRDIPQSIQVIPRQVIEDQQVTELPEAVRNVSGVVRTYGYAGSTDNYTIRGFTADFNLRNGFRDRGFYSYTDPANIEQVEVLKGPASVLYGQFEPGGVVNYVTKQPLSEPYYAAQFRVGSYDYYRPSFDISGPLNSDQTFLYRLNVAYENSGSFRDFVDKELFVFAPAFSYQIGDATTLSLQYEYVNLERTFDRGLPPIEEAFDLPIDHYLGEPTDLYDLDSDKINLTVEHRFSENLRLRSAFSAGLIESLRSNVQGRSFTLEDDGRTFRRRFTQVDDYTEDYSLQTDLISNFSTGSVNHQFVVGLELSKNNSGYTFLRTEFPSIDIFEPVYGFPIPDNFDTGFKNEQTTDTVGLYFQDQIELLPNLKLLVGGRFDFVDNESEDVGDIFSDSEPETIERYYEAFSPRVGLVYQPIEPISLYASYSRSFKPNFLALTAEREPLEPERGTQYEVGIKAELLEGRLLTTLAAYEITKSNVATSDPNDTDFSIAAGEVKSRGIELDVAGEILPGWNVIASYAYNDAFVSEDNSIPEGDSLVNAPSNSASLWTTYEIQSGSLQGLGFGAGVFFVGDREAQLPNTIEIPSYARTDATIFYRRDNYRISLNVQNLFDVKYYNSQGFLLYPGAPLTVYGQVSVEF